MFPLMCSTKVFVVIIVCLFLFFLALTKDVLDVYFTSYDLKRLAMYGNNMADYHLVMDLLPPLARLYFLNMMGNNHLSPVQSVRIVMITIKLII